MLTELITYKFTKKQKITYFKYILSVTTEFLKVNSCFFLKKCNVFLCIKTMQRKLNISIPFKKSSLCIRYLFK